MFLRGHSFSKYDELLFLSLSLQSAVKSADAVLHQGGDLGGGGQSDSGGDTSQVFYTVLIFVVFIGSYLVPYKLNNLQPSNVGCVSGGEAFLLGLTLVWDSGNFWIQISQ